jgi:Tol biopolymer transport system component
MIRDAEIEAQLRRIAASPVFAGAARSRQFLEFCVDRAMRGYSAELKETTIAVAVFLRTTDYNPKIDPIVRVHARRVREKLDLYYRTVGIHDPIRIDLPKGGYVPLILRTLPHRKTDFSDWAEPSSQNSTAGLLPVISAKPQTSMRSRWWFFGAAVLAAVLVFVLCFGLATVRPPVKPSLGILKPWDALQGRVFDPEWSPSGTRLAFSAISGSDPTPHIWIQNWTAETSSPPTRLTHADEPETRPIWSPDGRQIAFIRRVDREHFDIVRYDLASSHARLVGHFVTYWPLPSDHPALDWSPDGRYLLTSEQTAPSDPVRIILIFLSTGRRTSLTSPPEGSSGDIEARFSPDSQLVAFRRGGLGDLYVVSVKGEQVQPAVPLSLDNRGVRGIAWIDHGRSLLYGTQRDDTDAFGLWSVPAGGGVPRPVSPAGFDAVDPAVSASGLVVLVHRQIVDQLATLSLGKSAELHPMLPSGSIDSSPVYCPNGRQIAFISTRSGWPELWLYRLGAARPSQLTHFHGAGLIFLPAWSPDGRSIAFSFRQNGATNIFVYNLTTQSLRQITATSKRDITPAYSSDGRFIYFSSNNDGTSRIWRIRADGSNRAEPLFIEGVIGFEPSPDGKWLYFLREGPKVVLARENLADGAIADVAQLPGNSTFINDLAVTKDAVYAAVSPKDGSMAQLMKIDPRTGSSLVVARLRDIAAPSASGITGFTVSPDDGTLVYERSVQDESTFYVAPLTH